MHWNVPYYVYVNSVECSCFFQAFVRSFWCILVCACLCLFLHYRTAACYAANLSEHSQRTSTTKIVSIFIFLLSMLPCLCVWNCRLHCVTLLYISRHRLILWQLLFLSVITLCKNNIENNNYFDFCNLLLCDWFASVIRFPYHHSS